MAQAADVKQLDGLRFHALGGVDHHQRGIDGGEHAVGVFGEVLVAGGVEQVDHMVAVIKLHDRRGDRDAALFFDIHPVGGGEFAAFFAFDGAGHLDGTGEEQEFFGERGFAGVGVGDDGEGAAAGSFAGQGGQGVGHEGAGAGKALNCNGLGTGRKAGVRAGPGLAAHWRIRAATVLFFCQHSAC